MEQRKIFYVSKLEYLFKIALWFFLIVFAGKFVLDVLPYFGLNQEVFQRYWNYKWWLIGHITGGLLALVIGPFQFSETLRKKNLIAHRWFGRTYLAAILIAAISSTYLAWTSALAVHWTWTVSLQALAFAWICTTAMAFITIRQRRIESHREWMIRSYVITFAFVTFRWLVDLPAIERLGNFIERAPTIVWVSWVIPLLITNVALQWNKKRNA